MTNSIVDSSCDALGGALAVAGTPPVEELGAVERWKDGDDVSSEVRAASSAAWAHWLKSRAKGDDRAASHVRTARDGGGFPFSVEVFG
ncbi:hypothetical protein [Saccharopolyspora shandongensis]|uniref:hypothetical protein n=1 Tax=Saccharopolyspora shandongensis TaxID=418495 RepID=UPI0033F18863